jgi:predicted kinase
MKFIVFSGLPGTGKSSLAEAVGRQLQIPVFAKDWLEATLVGAGLVSNNKDKLLGISGYELLTVLAARQFKLGQSVILDCVAATQSIRDQWRELAAQHQAEWRVIECVCSDEQLHQTRLQKRKREIPNWYEIEWSDVQRSKTYFDPWNEQRLVLDSNNSFQENLASAIEYCS